MSDRFRPLLSFAFVVWMAFVLTAFYAVQKPITPQDIAALAEFPQAFAQSPSVLGLLDAILNVLTACLISVIAVVIGFRLSPLAYPYHDALTARAEYWLLSS